MRLLENVVRNVSRVGTLINRETMVKSAVVVQLVMSKTPRAKANVLHAIQGNIKIQLLNKRVNFVRLAIMQVLLILGQRAECARLVLILLVNQVCLNVSRVVQACMETKHLNSRPQHATIATQVNTKPKKHKQCVCNVYKTDIKKVKVALVVCGAARECTQQVQVMTTVSTAQQVICEQRHLV